MSFKNKNYKSLNCRECGEQVDKLSLEATSVVCWRCVSKALSKGTASCFEEETEKTEPQDPKK